MSETSTRVYELGYLLVPTIPEVEITSKVDDLKKTVTDLGGNINSSGAPEFIDLAYTIEKDVASKKFKWSQGYFGWMKFEAAPEALEALKKTLDGNTDIMRYILVKTHLENSVVFKKPKIEPKRDSGIDETLIEEEEIETLEDEQEVHETLPDLEGDITAEEKEEA
jgi:ribosomal protein S6